MSSMRSLCALGFTPPLVALASIAAAAASSADEPVAHHVTYTVRSEIPVRARIYYRDVDPPNWADYSHNPYQFSPRVEPVIGPGAPWVLDATLFAPDEWAMVTVRATQTSPTPQLQCELAVDGVVVDSATGASGVLCSIRNW